ncbi:MAG: D-alanyl-D-alanine carboxypeptidase [Sterolibacteriaceae bacterium]|nr:D-alanyl-D-alanine carboxypeptidase [Sterolibacteriaceae bacterium]
MQGSAEQATVRVSGIYPLACGEYRRSISVLSAERYFADAFLLAYEKAGGFLAGSVRSDPRRSDPRRRVSARVRPFETIASSPLPDIVREVNKQSNNLWAQQLFLRVGTQLAHKPVESTVASTSVDTWMRENLPQALPVTMETGAGLSANERISARGLVELLDHAARAKYANVFFDSLSIVGVDGTAASRMRDTPVAGNARVKTGTVSDARGLAGRLQSAGGSTVLFAILINHPRAGLAPA